MPNEILICEKCNAETALDDAQRAYAKDRADGNHDATDVCCPICQSTDVYEPDMCTCNHAKERHTEPDEIFICNTVVDAATGTLCDCTCYTLKVKDSDMKGVFEAAA